MNSGYWKASFLRIVALLAACLPPSIALPQSFGAMQQAFNVRVVRLFSGTSATWVQFSSLPGCSENGGYITASWSTAGPIDENRTKQIVATLLFAKGTDNLMEVRYRLNSAGTGWQSCTVDSVFLN
jgi:hypothetical protein